MIRLSDRYRRADRLAPTSTRRTQRPGSVSTEVVGAPDEMDERMVGGEQACDDLVRPVDLEEESPDLPGRLRPRGRALRRRAASASSRRSPRIGSPVERIPGRAPVELEERAVERAGTRRTPRRIVVQPGSPTRTSSGRGTLASRASPCRTDGKRLRRLVVLDQAHLADACRRSRSQRRPGTRKPDLVRQRREAVPEAHVDRRLEAQSAANGSPRSWMSSICARIIRDMRPRRRWVGSTRRP